MKKLLLTLIVSVCSYLPGEPVAECVYCPKIGCYSSDICGDCVCLRRDYSAGICVSIQ
jgi:hypothetical protein